jgi:hypothetical protein
MEPSQVATIVISIAFGLVTFFCWLATARANQRRHEDTVLLTYAAAWQRGDEQDLLVLGPVRRLVEERERGESAGKHQQVDLRRCRSGSSGEW